MDREIAGWGERGRDRDNKRQRKRSILSPVGLCGPLDEFLLHNGGPVIIFQTLVWKNKHGLLCREICFKHTITFLVNQLSAKNMLIFAAEKYSCIFIVQI